MLNSTQMFLTKKSVVLELELISKLIRATVSIFILAVVTESRVRLTD